MKCLGWLRNSARRLSRQGEDQMSNPSVPAAPIPEMAGAISSEGSRASGGIHTDATVQHPNVADLLRQLEEAKQAAERANANAEAEAKQRRKTKKKP